MTAEMSAYLATYLAAQDVTTLGQKAVRSHLNEHFGVTVDKDAFKTALTALLGGGGGGGGAATEELAEANDTANNATTTTTNDDAAAVGESDAAAPSKRTQRKAPVKKAKAAKASGGAGKKGKKKLDDDDDLLLAEAASQKINAAHAPVAEPLPSTAGDAETLINDIFGGDDADNATASAAAGAAATDADSAAAASTADGGASFNAALDAVFGGGDDDGDDDDPDDIEDKLFSKKRSRREADGADARAKRARKKAAAAAGAPEAAADDAAGDDDAPPKKKAKKAKKAKADADADADGGEKKKKKKAAKKKKDDDGAEPKPKKKRAPKKKKVVDGDVGGDDDDGSGGGGGGKSKVASEVDQLLDKMKRKQLKSTRTHDEKVQSIIQFREKMERVAVDDINSVANKQPALQKLLHIGEFVDALGKADLQTLMVGTGILEIIKIWLEPLPDGSLPSLKVREQLLQQLLVLPVEKEDLVDSKIGHIVMFLLKHPDETRANRELCERIVERWSRPIFERKSDYSRMPAPDTFEALPASGERPPSSLSAGHAGGHYVPENEGANDLEIHPLTGRVRRPRVNVPKPLKLDFSMQPASHLEPKASTQPTERKKEVLARLNSLKNKNGSIKRIQSVAVSRLEL